MPDALPSVIFFEQICSVRMSNILGTVPERSPTKQAARGNKSKETIVIVLYRCAKLRRFETIEVLSFS